MKRWLRAVALVVVLGTSGCAGLDSVDDYFGRNAASNSINDSGGCGGEGEALIMAPFAVVQLLYDLSQGY